VRSLEDIRAQFFSPHHHAHGKPFNVTVRDTLIADMFDSLDLGFDTIHKLTPRTSLYPESKEMLKSLVGAMHGPTHLSDRNQGRWLAKVSVMLIVLIEALDR
jgi:hypothetical protein